MVDAKAGADFLSRWSRRKRLARSGVDPDSAPPEADAGDPAVPSDAQGERTDAVPGTREELTDADMPPLETLDEESDYSAFLSPKVSEGLRRAALRKLFGAAAFNVTDGLDDYDEDFRSFSTLMDVVTPRAEAPGDSPAVPDEPCGARGAAPQAEESEVVEDTTPDTMPRPDREEPSRAPSAERDPEPARSRAHRDDSA